MSFAAPATSHSWAELVRKGFAPDVAEDLNAPRSPLVPAERGSLRTLCRGRLDVMLGHYGWVTSLDEIDYPDVESLRHEGRIYLKSTDVRHGCGRLTPGAEVVFALYADSDGLGAEDCRPAWANEDGLNGTETTGEAGVNSKTRSASKRSAGATSGKTQPWWKQDYKPPPSSTPVVLVPPAAVLEWLTGSSNTTVQTTGSDVFQNNMRRILDAESSSDDSSDDEDDCLAQRTNKTWSSLAGRCAKAIGDVNDALSWQARSDAVAAKDAGDHPSARFADPVISVLDSMAAKAFRTSDGDSTSVGDASDSEGGATATSSSLIIAPPPGLEFLAGSFGGVLFSAPPGLDAPLSSLPPTRGTAAPAVTPLQQHPRHRRRD